jgi:hypothetical protein
MTITKAVAKANGEKASPKSQPKISHFTRVAMGEEQYEIEMLKGYVQYWAEKVQEEGKGA